MVGVLTAGVLLLATVAYLAVLRSASASLDESLLRETEAFTAAISPVSGLDGRNLAEVSRAYLSGRTGGGGGFAPILLLRLESGRVISNSETRLENAEDNAALLDPATTARGFADVRYGGETYRTATAPVTDTSGQVIAAFQAASPTSALRDLARRLAISLTLAGVSVIAIGAVVSRIAARRSLDPLRAMSDAASRISFASLETRIAYDGPHDELGTLADSLNSMLDRLERAAQAQRHFVADASHELRTPVAVIRGNVDLMMHPRTTAEEKEQALHVIDEEVDRMARLFDELLALARTDADAHKRFQPLDAATMIGEAIGKARALGGHAITSTCTNDVWTLGDPDLLDRVFVNVLRNAVDHTPEGTPIEVACRDRDERVVITVRDHGPGIAEEDLPRVFDRFYRTRGRRASTGGGSGLGLAITKSLVELHGGTITAENAAGGGALFTISLPRTPPPD
jgi:two-component system OmpR family sensor kinase